MARLVLLPRGELPPLPGAPYQQWTIGSGEVIATFHRIPGGHLVRFPGRADYALAGGSDAVACTPVFDVAEQTVRFLFANQIVPLMQNRSGKLVLHGSAIACRDRALAFAGQSGRGKSTLAAAFARAGLPFLTDDGLLVEHGGGAFLAAPSHPSLRLWRDSESALFAPGGEPGAHEERDKRPVAASDRLPFHDRPLALGAIYLLGPGEAQAISIDPLTPAEAFGGLIGNAFILDHEDRARMRLQWEQVGNLAEAIPCFALDFPRRYDVLPALIDALAGRAGTGECAQ